MSHRMHFDDVTICIKVFERQNSCNRLIKQLREHGANMRIIVADDSEKPLDIQGADSVLRLPFDSGLSYGRNRMVESVDTKYFILLDDDNTIYKKTRFDLMYETITNTDFNIVGGMMRITPYYGVMYIDENNTLITHQLAWRGIEQGQYVRDYCDNFFMAETEVILNNLWDERIKIAWEHEDFFLQGKVTGDFKVCRVLSYVGDNQLAETPETIAHYEKFRMRYDDFGDLFKTKWGIEKCTHIKEKVLVDKEFVWN